MGAAAIPLIVMAAGTALQMNETARVERKQEDQQSAALIQREAKQRQADQRVDKELDQVAASTAEDERVERMGEYTAALRRGRTKQNQGLSETIGGQAFQADQSSAQQAVGEYGDTNAGLLSRIDAPTLQRQGEAFGYGRLGSDLNLVGREVQGDEFINQLRLRAIKRRPAVDFAAGMLSAAGGAMGGGGGLGGAASGAAVASQYPRYTQGLGTGPY